MALLRSISIRNFVLIEDATLELQPGLTVITGETGAGKTLLTQAIGLLLGERAGEGLVGTKGEEAFIQVVFELDEGEAREVEASVGFCDAGEGQLIAGRRLHRSGRNRCFLNNAQVTLASLGEVVSGLITFSGQHEHRRLTQSAYQRRLLDAYAGPIMAELLRRYRDAWSDARETRRLLAEAETTRVDREKEMESLRFQLAELDAARLSLGEEEALDREQRLLARAEEVATSAAQAAELLTEDRDERHALSLVRRARSRLAPLAGIDEELDRILGSLEELGYTLGDLSSQLRARAVQAQADPARLREVEERLRTYADLGRKYGSSADFDAGDPTPLALGAVGRPATRATLAYFEQARRRLDELEELDGSSESVRARCDRAVEETQALAAAITEIRCDAAARLGLETGTHLASLGMPGASFVLSLSTARRWEELGPDGGDEVEMVLMANPGLPPRSLARIASGGELSRTLLALKTALALCEGPGVLVFDEIDAGVGGLTASAVGRKLQELSRRHQVLAVTHLPQVAAFASHHWLIEKLAREEATVARLRALEKDEALTELCRMMGGRPEEAAALAHARALKDRAASRLLD